jgi:hypothetical protein
MSEVSMNKARKILNNMNANEAKAPKLLYYINTASDLDYRDLENLAAEMKKNPKADYDVIDIDGDPVSVVYAGKFDEKEIIAQLKKEMGK